MSMNKERQLLENSIFVEVMKAREHYVNAFSALFKKNRLTGPQYNVLRILRGAGPKGLPSLEIGKRLIHSVPDITRLIDRLSVQKLVERKRCQEDRRVVYATLTEKGREVLKTLDPLTEEIHHNLCSHMSVEDLKELNRLLKRCQEQKIEE
jgi:DNA-binding MarR family transcriptional regulator